MSLAVVTDSAACLTEPLLRERAIEVVPLHAIPADNGEATTTSRPSVQELVDAYRRAASRAPSRAGICSSSTRGSAILAISSTPAPASDSPSARNSPP